MLKPFSMIFFVAVMVWIGSIFVTSNPQTRIDRACLPATFADKVVVALVQVIHEPYALGAHDMMLALEYGCKFTVWKTFYEEREWNSSGHSSRRNQTDSVHNGQIQQSKQIRQSEQSRAHPGEMTEVRVPGTALPNYLEDK